MRPATPADIRHIAKTMWQRGVQELDALGIGPHQWLTGWHDRIYRGDAVAFDAGECVAILGCDWEGKDVICTAFQASRGFEDPAIGWRVTKEMRRAIPALLMARKARISNTYSLCIHPEAERWFRLLGLREDTTFQGPLCGSFHLRKFWRRV